MTTMSLWQQRLAGVLVLVALAGVLFLLFWPSSGPSVQECNEARAWSTPQCREAAGRDYEGAIP